MKKVFFAFLGMLIIVLPFVWLKYGVSYAQSSCCNPPLITPRIGWSKNSNITVTISSAFTESERQAIISAFETWNDNKLANCSNVTYSSYVT